MTRPTREEQQDCARDLAQQIERGEPLDETERHIVAWILRAWADIPIEAPRRTRGQLPKYDHVVAAWGIELARRNGKTKETAIADAAMREGVSIEAMKKTYNKLAASIAELLDSKPNQAD
jgi:hypothetical protein